MSLWSTLLRSRPQSTGPVTSAASQVTQSSLHALSSTRTTMECNLSWSRFEMSQLGKSDKEFSAETWVQRLATIRRITVGLHSTRCASPEQTCSWAFVKFQKLVRCLWSATLESSIQWWWVFVCWLFRVWVSTFQSRLLETRLGTAVCAANSRPSKELLKSEKWSITRRHHSH